MKSKVLSEMMGVPLSTVYRYVAQLKKDGKLEPLLRTERPTSPLAYTHPKSLRQVYIIKRISNQIISTALFIMSNKIYIIRIV